MYTQDTIDAVRAISAAEIIGSRLKIKKQGSKFFANCPFHDEKSDSFTITPSENIWKCFGCQKGGDVIKFIQEYENLDFAKAVELLANEKGIMLRYTDDKMTPEQRKEQKTEKDAMYEMLEYACQAFEMSLDHAEEAKAKLYERGVTDEDIKKWRLGYAPAGWSFLKAQFTGNGKLPMAIKLDLVKQKDEKNGDVKYYDTFRNRVMIPICDEQNRVIGFGAWNYSGEENADGKVVKYINNAETELYKKESTLYGINHAKATIIKSKVAGLTEGYFDVITAHRAEMSHIVGTCGTAVTDKHMKIFTKWSIEKVEAYGDNDSAGMKSKMKIVDKVLSNGMLPMVAVWDSNIKDLDDLIRTTQ